MTFRRTFFRPAVLFVAIGITAQAHDAFLPLHEHRPSDHRHGAPGGTRAHGHHAGAEPDAKQVHAPEPPAANRWVVATGVQYTRYSVENGRAELWETGLGFEFALLPWLHVGGDVSYGWFDSHLGNSSGWLMPHAHVDAHLPLGAHWELLIGGTVGFPGGDEALVGDHWEFEPHLELSYDRHRWFVRAGAGLVFVRGGTKHDSHAGETEEDHAEHAQEDEELHAGDYHEITHPHADTEFTYYGAAGFRLLDERLTVEARLSGTRVLEGETEHRNFLRAGLLASFRLSENTSITGQVSAPISDAERNQLRASLGFRIEF